MKRLKCQTRVRYVKNVKIYEKWLRTPKRLQVMNVSRCDNVSTSEIVARYDKATRIHNVAGSESTGE